MKKTFFKKLTQTTIAIFAIMLATLSCKKDNDTIIAPKEIYTSVADFYKQNGVQSQNFTVNAATGGSFTTAKGTIIRVPANAFINNMGNLITGNVNIEFKDIYSKADMLLSDKPTITSWGTPLKSAGEFFITAKVNGNAIRLNGVNPIEVVQPAKEAVDTLMQPFVANIDSAKNGGFAWGNGGQFGNVRDSVNSYIFSLYTFKSPIDSGTWCNSDNQYFFNNYPQTVLTLHPIDAVDSFRTDVFLVFKTVNSMIHVYKDFSNPQNFTYYYAPVGLQCTVVAIGIKNGVLYSSFTPTTITANQTINFSLTATTTADFVAAIKLL